MQRNTRLAGVIFSGILAACGSTGDGGDSGGAAPGAAGAPAANPSGGAASAADGGASTEAGARVCPPAALGTAIVVDACAPRSDSGRDDLASARAIFRAASYPESNNGLDPTMSILKSVGFDRVRLINTQGSLDDKGAFVPGDRLRFGLGDAKRAQVGLHLIVGQWRPDPFPDPATAWDAGTWSQYEQFAYQYVKYAAIDFDGTGFADAFFEVGNEIDGTQSDADLWAIGSGTPQADAKRYDGYFKVYTAWAHAVDRLAKENPTRKIGIGGPALSGTFYYGGSGNWLERFVDDVAKANLRLDALTFHFYGDFDHGLGNAPLAGSALVPRLAGIRSHLAAAGRANTDVFVTEWGPSDNTSWTDGVAPAQQASYVNFGAPSAAWTASFLSVAASAGVTGGSLLEVRDNFGADRSKGSLALPSFSHVENDRELAKPLTNACRAFTMLPGTHVAATSPSARPHLHVFASAANDAAGVIVANYAVSFAANTDESADETIDVGFANLAFSGPAHVERYLVDEKTSDLLTALAAPTPDPAMTDLQKVESFDATVAPNGTLTLDARTLGKSAVSLWLVTKRD